MKSQTIRIKKAKDGSFVIEHSYSKKVKYKGDKYPTTKYYDDTYTAKNSKELIAKVNNLVTTLTPEPTYEEEFKEITKEL